MFSPLYTGKVPALFYSGLLISTTLLVGGCASTETRDTSTLAVQKPAVVDPYESFNRPMYNFNMGLDKYFLKPVANGYKFITPDFMETGVSNFFTNLKGINVVLNDVLQGKFDQSASDTGRFLTNSTIGVVGLFDVASEFGMESHVEDFGQTLAVWGVDQGAYLVLPVLGPTTFRDGGGIIVDKAANPGTYVPGTGIIEGINDRANAEGALNFIDEAALDPYVFTRESFLQYRNNLINDGKTDAANYDLDVDAALEDSAAASGKPKNAAKTGGGSGNTGLDSSLAPASSQSKQALSQVEQEFAEADEKMDQLVARKKRRHRR